MYMTRCQPFISSIIIDGYGSSQDKNITRNHVSIHYPINQITKYFRISAVIVSLAGKGFKYTLIIWILLRQVLYKEGL